MKMDNIDRLKQHKLEIIYQDDKYFIINKPYNCRIQPDITAKEDQEPSVTTLIQQQYPDLPPLKNVHQLNYATSGIYVQAFTRKAAGAASQLFAKRLVTKTYLAIVRGHIEQHNEQGEYDITIDKPIGNDPSHHFRMCILPVSLGGKASFTGIKILQKGYYYLKSNHTENNDEYIPVTKVLLFPKSGRRHQLRVHLQSIGHSIIGDFNYETPYTDTYRMMLHAYKIHLPLPFGDITLETPDPFNNLLHDTITIN
ncbi:unnamed protein product [Cunninghamella blakesleeana]